MPVKINIGLSRKVGEANFGSRGASINLEVELDNGLLSEPAQLRERVRDLYRMARSSVDEELLRSNDNEMTEPANTQARIQGPAVTAEPTNGHPRNGRGHGNTSDAVASRNEVTRATQSQIRAIFAIAREQGLDPHQVIHERYRRHRMEDLTIREASVLIDVLKDQAVVPA